MTDTSNKQHLVGLETRNIFLDTQVFRFYGHNLNTKIMELLGRYVAEGICLLHTTDVTLREISSQLGAMESDLTIRSSAIATFTTLSPPATRTASSSASGSRVFASLSKERTDRPQGCSNPRSVRAPRPRLNATMPLPSTLTRYPPRLSRTCVRRPFTAYPVRCRHLMPYPPTPSRADTANTAANR